MACLRCHVSRYTVFSFTRLAFLLAMMYGRTPLSSSGTSPRAAAPTRSHPYAHSKKRLASLFPQPSSPNSIVLFANAGGGGGGGGHRAIGLAERNSISTADPADGGVGGGRRGRGLVLLVGWCAPSRSTYLLLPRLLSCRWRKLGCLAGARGLDELFGRPRQQRRQQQHPATAAHTQSSAVAAAPP